MEGRRHRNADAGEAPQLGRRQPRSGAASGLAAPVLLHKFVSAGGFYNKFRRRVFIEMHTLEVSRAYIKSDKPLLTASDLSMKRKEVGLTRFCYDARAGRVAAGLL